MRAGFDDKLQSKFPEGKLFSNAIFSISIIEFCEANSCFEDKYSKILDENIERILSKKTLRNFTLNMKPQYGMFYNGWSLYVLKSYQRSKLFEFSSIQQKVNEEAAFIEQRLLTAQTDSIRILDTYEAWSWPADNLIGLISIENDTVRQKWVKKIFSTAEHKSGLINHAGNQAGMIRGSSQALIAFCLNKIEYDQILEYNSTFKKKFVDDYLGVQLVKENEDGSNSMDADSGPVVFGYGASGTIMNIKTQASIHPGESKATWAVMNALALPINILGKKYYLFKQEPMFDIFMLWGSVELN